MGACGGVCSLNLSAPCINYTIGAACADVYVECEFGFGLMLCC